jgi:hypothetical protein
MKKLITFICLTFIANIVYAQSEFGAMCGDQYVNVSQEALKAYYRTILELGPNVELEDATIVTYVDNNETKYCLQTFGHVDNVHYSIRTSLVANSEGQFYMVAEGQTCTCKSTGCSQWGCNATLFGNLCACDPCGGDDSGAKCEKTSTVSNLSMFCR